MHAVHAVDLAGDAHDGDLLVQGAQVTPSEIMAYIAPQLTSYKRPSQVIVLDALPATSSGKILKHKLAESLQAT